MSERISKLKIPYVKETERLMSQYVNFVWQQLINGKSFSPTNLRGLVFNYPNTLLLGIQEKLHHALEKNEKLRTKPIVGNYVDELSYLLPRLIAEKDASEIFQRIANGEKVHIHFVEKIADTQGLNIKRPKLRGRRYLTIIDEQGEKHFIFEVRRQTINNEKNPPTDFLELMSFLGFYEMIRYLVRLSIERPDFLLRVSKHKKLLSLINRYLPKGKKWDFEKLKTWATSTGGFFLEPYQQDDEGKFLFLSSLEREHNIENTALYTDGERIKNKLEENGISPPETIVLGNEFIFPLIIALPLLTDEDLVVLRRSRHANKKGAPLDLLPPSIKKDRLNSDEKDLIERFMYLQFLSKYRGDDSSLNSIKKRIFSKIEEMGVRKRLFEAEGVSLGDPVDYYDFSKLDDKYLFELEKLPNNTVKEILRRLKNEGKRFLNFSYPLGDNTYGLIESLKAVMPGITNVIFFGKVGATLSWDGQNHLGARVGRVVVPEYVSSINDFDPKKFIDRLKDYNIDEFPIIVNRDVIEIIFQSEGVLLQTLMDIKRAQEAVKRREDIPYNDKIRLLIDMESWYLNLICQKLGIIPSVIYYTSDNTKIPPLAVKNIETIVSSLGPRGSFAILVVGLMALNAL